MSMNTHDDLIHDWNLSDASKPLNPKIHFDDETLRDGLQSPSVKTPSIEDKLQILHYMHKLGIQGADIGLPGAGPHVVKDVTRIAQEIVEQKLDIYPNCAARTLIADIEPIAQISQTVGMRMEVAAFIGSSPIRQFAENWDVTRMLKHTEEAVRFCVDNDLDAMYVTEDTTRALPETLEKLYLTAIEAGAKRICISDTVGHATPAGTHAIVRFIQALVKKSGEEVLIDWHGHNDRGLALANALAAIEAGVDRVHGTALGIGERIGNTQMDQLLVNLKLMGVIDNDLSSLMDYCTLVAKATGMPVSINYPVIGDDAFRTGTGVHAAAIIKALKKNDTVLADRVYSSVPASMVGRRQKIEVGPMSGLSNVAACLEYYGESAEPELMQAIFQRAKESEKVLTEDEIKGMIREYRG